jgi:hypothetical protein
MQAKLRSWQMWMDKAVNSGRYTKFIAAPGPGNLWSVHGTKDDHVSPILAKYENQHTAEDVANMLTRKINPELN